MGALSKIQWTDHTFNPWIGCTKVSPGCAHCYAEELDRKRFSKTLDGASKAAPVSHWGPGAPRHVTSEANWKQPRAWNLVAKRGSFVACSCGWRGPKSALDHSTGGILAGMAACPECNAHEGHLRPVRPRIFCASLADWLDREVDPALLCRLFELIAGTEDADWLLLTKRPQNWRDRVQAAWDAREDDTMTGAALAHNWKNGFAPRNVVVGCTMEDRQRGEERLDPWMDIPAARRFLSIEPQLEEIDLALRNWCDLSNPKLAVHQVIVGGESGANARPFDVNWARLIIEDAQEAGVPVFVKQLGALPFDGVKSDEDAGIELKDKKGGDMAEWPDDLRVREPMLPLP